MTVAPVAIARWLRLTAVLVLLMVVVGGVTRLTRSGLSITEWRPLSGALPPRNAAEWQQEFAKYRETPEYREVNRGMTLGEFKRIFLVEYAHRLLGRLVGLVFGGGLLFFLFRRALDRRAAALLFGLLLLGGLQGALGWIMVKSGLVDVPRVSPYRLAAHLMLAVLLYMALLGAAAACDPRARAARVPGPRGLRRAGLLLVGLILAMMTSGAFVAGTRAGFAYNTFPTMAGALVPPGLLDLEPAYVNLFENVVTVQFIHRLLSVLLAAAVLGCWLMGLKSGAGAALRGRLHLLLLAFLLQFALGVATLLSVVAIPLAAAHQAGALVLLTAALRALPAAPPARAPADS